MSSILPPSRTFLPAMGLVNALGAGADMARLFSGDVSGLQLEEGWLPGKKAYVGRARAQLPGISPEFSAYACRNNQLLLAALSQIQPAIEQVIERFGRNRIGVVLGTSTSGMAEGEAAVAAYHQSGTLPADFSYIRQELGMPSEFLARYLQLKGPAYAVSTACTSSAKAFQSARRLLQLGLCDAVIAGGVDSLCRLTVNGFASLESISDDICNPMSRHRRGINIGEGAALFLMTREEAEVELLGIGESSDAYHISSPHPEGEGAAKAMKAALTDASLKAADIDYLNLHATATVKNDEMESRAISAVFSETTICSGTKPMTGHTLGAAGATELAFCWLALKQNRIPPHIWDGISDPALPAINLASHNMSFSRNYNRTCMSNSFAFGGSNVSLIIGDCR